MALIEPSRVAGQDVPHPVPEIRPWRRHDEVNVVSHQAVRLPEPFALGPDVRKQPKEAVSVDVVLEDKGLARRNDPRPSEIGRSCFGRAPATGNTGSKWPTEEFRDCVRGLFRVSVSARPCRRLPRIARGPGGTSVPSPGTGPLPGIARDRVVTSVRSMAGGLDYVELWNRRSWASARSGSSTK